MDIQKLRLEMDEVQSEKSEVFDLMHSNWSDLLAEVELLQATIDGFWEYLYNAYDLESREELEEYAKGWNPPNPLMVALHYIWKREPKVVQLQAEVDKLRAAVGESGSENKKLKE